MNQFNRVVKVASGRKWRTLRDLESVIIDRFNVADTQAAISARLRDISGLARLKLAKETRTERINNKTVWFYRLVKL